MPVAGIEIRQCSLDLPVYGAGSRSLKQAVMSAATGGRMAFAGRSVTVVNALVKLDLDIHAGDRVGLMGPNGAGKTTLLRVLAGIYEPSAGVVRVNGNVTSLIDVTLGMDYEATGYENIVLRGLTLGLTKTQMRNMTAGIKDFSGLGDYLSMPVRTYSSGMVLRLAFSIVTSVRPEILLMDEWLSVGDAEFVAKAEARLRQLVNHASIMVMASHNAKIIDDLCNVKVRMEKGRIVHVERK